MDFNWDAVQHIVVIAYTVWKWKTEKDDRDERKLKERLENPKGEQDSTKRSEK